MRPKGAIRVRTARALPCEAAGQDTTQFTQMQPRECQLRGRDFIVVEEPGPLNMEDLAVFLGGRWGCGVGSLNFNSMDSSGRDPTPVGAVQNLTSSRDRMIANRGPSSLAQRFAAGSGSGGVSPHPAAVGPDSLEPLGTATGS